MRKMMGDKFKLTLAMIGTVAAVSWVAGFLLSGGPAIVSAQNDPFLSRRIDQIEQRFLMLESRLNRIEQESRRVTIAPGTSPGNQADADFLRTQIAAFRTRLGEAECGLLRLDERTLTVAARAARRKGQESETCRLNVFAPISLSARP